MEKVVIEKAKDQAKAKNRSLSDIFENYLKILTKKEGSQKNKKLHPVVKSLKESLKMSDNMDYKKELDKRLEERYL